eukprot:2552379-Alexandrium_andersonii.AAC.1
MEARGLLPSLDRQAHGRCRSVADRALPWQEVVAYGRREWAALRAVRGVAQTSHVARLIGNSVRGRSAL